MRRSGFALLAGCALAPLSVGAAAPSDSVIFVSSSSSGSVGGVSFADEDILAYDTATGGWSMHFDGSDVGVRGEDVDAVWLMDDGSLLMSFTSSASVGSLGDIDDSDIVRFIPSSLGSSTSGRFEWFLDGSDVGLTESGEDVDAIGFAPDGRLLVSTKGSFDVPGLSGKDEDLIVLDGATGTWELYFDGSDVGLTNSDEDVYGVWIDPSTGEIYLAARGDFSTGGVSGAQEDIFVCLPTSLGSGTSCTSSLFWDGSAHGFGGENLDAISIEVSPTPATDADLEVTKSDGVTSVPPGGGLTYTIHVTNLGPLDTADTTVTDIFPPELIGLGWTTSGTLGATGFEPTGSGNLVDSGIALPAGATVTYSVSATVDPATPEGTTLMNTASAEDGVVPDPDPLNSESTDNDTVVRVPVPDSPGPLIYMSSSSSGSVDGISFADEDILEYDVGTDSWSMLFDGSDVGVGGNDLDGFLVMADGSILQSFKSSGSIPGLGTVDDSDIVRFIPSSLGSSTAGSFEWFLDGSDVGLTGSGEDVDAVGFAPDGRLVISTSGSFGVDGLSGKDEDLIVLDPDGASWEMYFDGSDVGLTSSDEDVLGTWIDPESGEIFLTMKGDFSADGVSGGQEDILRCIPGSLGSSTSCSLSVSWDGSNSGLGGERVDAISLSFPVEEFCGDGIPQADEECDGGSCCSAACTHLAAGTECRAAAGVCDLPESCTGSTASCPPDGFDGGTACRASAGACDLPESCDGSGPDCPADAKSAAECRASTNVCDPAESCDGVSDGCPPDGFAPASTNCRPTDDVCDLPESCSGSSAACPTDSFVTEGTVCDDTPGDCFSGTCTGSSASCSGTELAPAGFVCRPAAGPCDLAEACTGTDTECPPDGFEPETAVCRPAAAACDAAESCTGSSAACPTDAPLAPGTSCDDEDSCTEPDACDGFSCAGPDVCGTPFQPFGTVTVQPDFDVNGAGSNIDQIAFWEAPDPTDTLMLVSAKGNDLIEVWRFPFVSNQQSPLDHSSLSGLNGVSTDNETDILYAATDSTVATFSLPGLQPLGTIDASGGSEQSTTILNRPDAEKRLYTGIDDAILIHNAETGSFIGQFDTATAIENVAADDFYQVIYTLDEKDMSGVHVYGPAGAHLANFGTDDFQADGEGVLLYSCRDGQGVDTGKGLIVGSDQISSRTDFEFYDRETGDHLGTLRLSGVSNTDGIASTQVPLPGYAMGLFAAINDDTSTAGVGWDVIFNATGLSCF